MKIFTSIDRSLVKHYSFFHSWLLCIPLFFISVSAFADDYSNFLSVINNKDNWSPVFVDNFGGSQIKKNIWRIESDDSTGGCNSALQAYNGGNVNVANGHLELIAKPQWYVQPIGYKGYETCGTPPAQRVARPYTSARIDTYGKVAIDLGKPGRIDIQFQPPSGIGSWPAIWMFTKNKFYGEWSASGEIDILEEWKKTDYSNPQFNGYPRGSIWFGGPVPENALLTHATSLLTPDAFHTVTFVWDAKGTFVWQLDGITTYVVTPTEILSRASLTSALLPQTPGYISIFGILSIMNQPYQGVYVADSTINITHPGPAPFDSNNLFYLIIENQVGGSPFDDLQPMEPIFDAGNSVDLTHTPNGILSDAAAATLGLPARPSAFFTNDNKMIINYVKYSTIQNNS